MQTYGACCTYAANYYEQEIVGNKSTRHLLFEILLSRSIILSPTLSDADADRNSIESFSLPLSYKPAGETSIPPLWKLWSLNTFELILFSALLPSQYTRVAIQENSKVIAIGTHATKALQNAHHIL